MSDPPAFTVDVPTAADVPDLAAVHVSVWREAYGELLPTRFYDEAARAHRADTWRSFLTSRPATELRERVRAARDATGAVVGFCLIGPPRDADALAGIELQALNVLAAMHGTGVARALVDDLLGDRPAYLWVADPNPRAQTFYAKLGFTPDGIAKTDPDLEDLREIRMVR